jgi:cell division protein FtsI (penicillin-binding protein 3)
MRTRPLSPLTKSTNRLLILGISLAGWAAIVVLRLFQLQVLAHDKYERLGQAQQERLEPMDAPRGAILDRNGNYLAISSPSKFVVVNPARIPDKNIAAALLARILGIDAAKLEADLDAAAVSRHHHGYFVVDPQVTDEKAEEVRAMKLDWAEIREGSLRTYPNGQLASHVVGNVGAEGHGAAGVELKLDKDLAGIPGMLRVQVDVRQRPYASEVAKLPTVGKNIGLTIDSQIQHVAEEAIQYAVVHNHGEHGSIVAMDPNTGEILALANYPTYDANERLHAGELAHGREDLAVVAPYEPGSVFKIITLSAALETTHLRPESLINTSGGVITLFGRTIHDAHAHGGMMTMAEVLARSSNVGAIRIGMEVGAENLYAYVRKFGVGSRTGIELPAEAPGMLRRLNHWQPTSLPSVAFGHEISTTTVQLARMGSVIANGGFLVSPHIVAWEQSPGGPKEFKKLLPPVQILKPETVMTMRQMMRGVVALPYGTGHRLHLIGYTLAGKTGTAQIFDFAHHVYTHKYNASFLGFAPMVNPNILICVTVSGTTGEAGMGASASGPAFQQVAEAAMRLREVPRDVPEEVDELEQKELAQKEKLEKLKNKGKPDDAEEEDSLADLSTPLTDEEMAQAEGTVDAPKTPDFTGKTVKGVMEEAAADGLDVQMLGNGLARAQYPAPGAPLLPGTQVRVRFSR